MSGNLKKKKIFIKKRFYLQTNKFYNYIIMFVFWRFLQNGDGEIKFRKQQ